MWVDLFGDLFRRGGPVASDSCPRSGGLSRRKVGVRKCQWLKVSSQRAKEAQIENEELGEQNLWKELPGKDGVERAEILIELAKQAIYRSQGGEALALAEEAHKIYKSMGAKAPTVAMANAITGISYSLKELNKVDEAVKVIDGAIDLLREGSYPFVVDTLRTKAGWLVDIGQYESAISTYLEATAINEIDGENEFYARDLFGIAVCFAKLGKWLEVIEHSSRARESFKAEKLVDEVAWCDVLTASAYAELGNGDFALDIAQRAYDLSDLRNLPATKCNAALAMGMALTINGCFEDAEAKLAQAREMATRSTDWEIITKIEKEFINLYLVQGKVEAAEELERRLESLTEIVSE